ncbi:MAG: prepilin-type N-terminal cleavage/methylation domain-containing protein [Candidatus Peribacteria bacterium]|jgi:type II secretory pathway pseudopilin PulG|nr:prepilin-type N-terminal cleavage/methylation domain-containing protein [Candidatus Peribacteria bacterium]
MLKKNSFTLVEMLFVILIISILLPIIFSSYTRIQQQKHELDLRQKLYQQTYEVLERMNVLLQDYTVDYEEYFNRQMVGCVGTAKR